MTMKVYMDTNEVHMFPVDGVEDTLTSCQAVLDEVERYANYTPFKHAVIITGEGGVDCLHEIFRRLHIHDAMACSYVIDDNTWLYKKDGDSTITIDIVHDPSLSMTTTTPPFNNSTVSENGKPLTSFIYHVFVSGGYIGRFEPEFQKYNINDVKEEDDE